jgi:repressor LexA
MKGLTERQERVLGFLRDFLRERGMPPTVREIGAGMGFNFPAARGHLKALEKKGCLKLRPGVHRGIELLDDNAGPALSAPPMGALALVGTIRAGRPITAREEIETYIAVDRELFRDQEAFVLRVTGESMVGAGIFDGDYVVVSPRSEVPRGGIGVALVDEEEATVKRIYSEGAVVRLVPENPTMQPTEHQAGDVRVLGRVSGVIRKL